MYIFYFENAIVGTYRRSTRRGVVFHGKGISVLKSLISLQNPEESFQSIFKKIEKTSIEGLHFCFLVDV
jgi:hypothetical protein